MLEKRAARHVTEFRRTAGQRDPDPFPRKEIRTDLRQPTILPQGREAGLDRHLQVNGLRENMAAISVLLVSV